MSDPSEVHEDRATPTEPGLYLDRLGNVWHLYRDGVFAMVSQKIRAAAAYYAPFKRLQVAESAADVVVTVEQIAETLCRSMDEESFDGNVCGACKQQAQAVAELLRGEGA